MLFLIIINASFIVEILYRLSDIKKLWNQGWKCIFFYAVLSRQFLFLVVSLSDWNLIVQKIIHFTL